MDLPLYFIVGERPVQLISTPDGGLDCQVFDWGTRQFTRDLTYLSRCIGPVPSEEADPVDEATFHQHVEQLRGRPRFFLGWREALTKLLRTRATPPWAEWTCLSDPGWELAAWDDPRHQQGTVIPMDSPSSYVERFVTVRWDRGTVHSTQQDLKTGGGDATHELAIPPDWLEPLKKVPWPVTGASPLF